jgi:hypothetical protein
MTAAKSPCEERAILISRCHADLVVDTRILRLAAAQNHSPRERLADCRGHRYRDAIKTCHGMTAFLEAVSGTEFDEAYRHTEQARQAFNSCELKEHMGHEPNI